MTDRTLLILSPVAVTDPNADPLNLPRRMVDQWRAFAELWDGSVTVLLPRAARRDDNLDYVPTPRAKCAFAARAFPTDEQTLRAELGAAGVVYVPLVPWFVAVHTLAHALHIPVVYITDFTFEIRKEIVCAQTRNPILRWRRLLYVTRLEKKYRRMLREAAGIQLQDVPAYNAYGALNRAALGFFNTHMRRDMLATTAQLNARAERLRAGAPLRLVYSGRWNAIKGVDDLPRVARRLRERNVPFELDIFGGGVLEDNLRRALADARLNNVRLRGELPFAELMRVAANEHDLFVCCHKQGDPSTTFNEMLGAGIPLIGYAYDGLRGALSQVNAGWLTPRNDVDALAARIAELERNRESIIAAGCAAAEFTRVKTFDDMMQARTAHLRAVLETRNKS
jgi:colanic acid/amylovoran biosynthesis glycosyltransferase